MLRFTSHNAITIHPTALAVLADVARRAPEDRTNFRGVFLDPTYGAAVATDGLTMLAACTAAPTRPDARRGGVMIPCDVAARWARTAAGPEIAITWDSGSREITASPIGSAAGGVATVPAAPGEFPRWETFMPAALPHRNPSRGMVGASQVQPRLLAVMFGGLARVCDAATAIAAARGRAAATAIRASFAPRIKAAKGWQRMALRAEQQAAIDLATPRPGDVQTIAIWPDADPLAPVHLAADVDGVTWKAAIMPCRGQRADASPVRPEPGPMSARLAPAARGAA